MKIAPPVFWPEQHFDSNLDAEIERASDFGDIESIFTDSMSLSSTSSLGLNPIHVKGIREVAGTLLSHDGFKSLCTTTITNIAPRKNRAHIKGFLKRHGQKLDEEASS
jgi:hypothetical protein